MSSEQPVNPRFADDMQMRLVDGPATYARRTDKPVSHLSVADPTGKVVGYVWANDEDDAAGWVAPQGLTGNALNAGGAWVRALRSGKARGLAPSDLLAELAQGTNDNNLSHAVPDSLTEAPSLDALKELAARS